MRTLEDTTFLLLIIAVSLAFAWIIWPLYGAVLWASVTAIVFAPLHRKLSGLIGPRHNLAALATALIIVAIIILPLTMIGASLLQEASGLYEKIQSGELNLVRIFRQVLDGLPAWAANIVRRFGLTSLGAVQEALSTSLLKSSQFLTFQAFSLGQSTFDFIVNLFVMMYLLFFLLRDGDVMELPAGKRINAADIVSVDCDIWIPAARPDVLREDNVDALRARLVLQGANIPATAGAERRMHERGILSIPDFIANAGGVIAASVEYHGGTEHAAFDTIADKVAANTFAVLELMKSKNILPREAAVMLARARVERAMNLRRWQS